MRRDRMLVTSKLELKRNSFTRLPLSSLLNHEGSLLLWLLVLTFFIFLFLIKSKEQPKKYRILTVIFQQIIIIGFFSFVLFTSNPFNYLFPRPSEGLGLNPILQDPALAIHPPILYVGYVGTSLIFSATLAAVVENYISKDWAKNIKFRQKKRGKKFFLQNNFWAIYRSPKNYRFVDNFCFCKNIFWLNTKNIEN